MEELIETIEHDNIVKLKALCKAGLDLTQPIDAGLEYGLEEPDYMPVLFFAIRKQASLEFIEVLLENGLKITDVDDDGLSALDIAIKFKREDVVEFCLEKGIDINTTSRKSGLTPILLASCFNNTSMVELLLKHGADINATDSNGMSAKDYAKKLGQTRMCAFLEEHGAKYGRYPEEEKATPQQSVPNKAQQQGDMKNRAKPTDDMGFDSI